MTTVLVIGGTGVVGRHVVSGLRREGHEVRVGTREPGGQVSDWAHDPAIETVTFDWNARADVDSLMHGVGRLMVIPPRGVHPLPTTDVLLRAATAAGVDHVVFLSTLGADFTPGFAFGRWALEGERAVAASPLRHTILRPNSFMSNFTTMLRPHDDGALRLPWGDAATTFVDPRDVAEVAVRVLCAPAEHAGTVHELTGREALTAHEVVTSLGTATQQNLRYEPIPLEHFKTALRRAGAPGHMVEAHCELHAVMGSGARGYATDAIHRVTGRLPRTIDDFARDHAGAGSET